VKCERLGLGGEVEHPQDVDHREDKVACAHRLQPVIRREDAGVSALHSEDGRDGTEGRELEARGWDGAHRDGENDADVERSLEEDGEPEGADGTVSDYCFRMLVLESRGPGMERTLSGGDCLEDECQ
jgi:hypothetical protein